MAKASKAKVEEAFTAGFEDKDIDLGAELDENTPAADIIAAATNEDLEANKPEIKDKATETDDEIKAKAEALAEAEWAGVPLAIRNKFEAMNKDLTRVQNMASSASGRANKLQGIIDKKANEAPEVKPVLTSEELLGAMVNKDKRELLREEFGEFAAALDEVDESVSTSVGSAIDKLRIEMRAEAKKINEASMAELEIKRTLDNKHPGWENTIQDKKFKTWVYEGGPGQQESDYYESLVFQANQAAPADAAALFGTASKYFDTLVVSHPVWAEEKGKLFGDSSGEAAISMLDLFVKDNLAPAPTAEELAAAAAEQQDEEENLFEANLVPTRGNSHKAPVATTDAVNKAFEDGFNS